MIQLRGNPTPPQFNSKVSHVTMLCSVYVTFCLLTFVTHTHTALYIKIFTFIVNHLLGSICEQKLLQNPLVDNQLSEDPPVQSAVEEGRGGLSVAS